MGKKPAKRAKMNTESTAKGKKLDLKIQMEVEDSRKEWEDTRIIGEKERKDK